MTMFKNVGLRYMFFAFVGMVIFSLGAASLACASGEGHHHHEHSDHMKSMMSVKDLIPEEYLAMDRTPVAPTPESINQGRDLYLSNCSVCHGKEGKGDGPAASSLKTKPANFLDKGHSSIYGPGEKYWIVANGIEATGMPGFPKLSAEERWHLVNFIIELQTGMN